MLTDAGVYRKDGQWYSRMDLSMHVGAAWTLAALEGKGFAHRAAEPQIGRGAEARSAGDQEGARLRDADICAVRLRRRAQAVRGPAQSSARRQDRRRRAHDGLDGGVDAHARRREASECVGALLVRR